MSFYLFAWVATIAWGLFALVGKLTSKHAISNPWLFNFFWNFFVLILMIPLAVINHVGMPKEWMFLTLASLSNAVWFILYAFSVYWLDISVLSPLYNFRTIFAVLLGSLFLHEQLAILQIVLFIIIFIAGIVVSFDEKFHVKSFFNKFVGTTILGMFFLALSNVLTKPALAHNGLWETTLAMNFLTVLFLLPTIPLFSKSLKKVSKKQLSPLFFMSLLAVIGTVTANEAFRTNVGLTSIILAIPVSMIFAFLIAIVKPQILEKHTFKVYAVRFTAAFVMLVAGLILSS